MRHVFRENFESRGRKVWLTFLRKYKKSFLLRKYKKFFSFRVRKFHFRNIRNFFRGGYFFVFFELHLKSALGNPIIYYYEK